MIVMPHTDWGYSLIELLIAITITLILLSITPLLGDMIGESRQQTQSAELNRMIELARNNAITTHEITTLCASIDGSQCVKDARLPTILVFADRNTNHEFDADDRKIHDARSTSESWHWRGSGGRPYLRFRADGSVMEWGSFTLCPNRGASYAARLVLNFSGRPYIARLEGDELQDSGLCNPAGN
jgi:prepilin-type N-terminal cleavage/methylation domain-containing protein